MLKEQKIFKNNAKVGVLDRELQYRALKLLESGWHCQYLVSFPGARRPQIFWEEFGARVPARGGGLHSALGAFAGEASELQLRL